MEQLTRHQIRIPNPRTDRLTPFEHLSWWQRERVEAARVMVVGAGAIGNEVLKNLTLMGFGHIVIVDFDHIERTNLSRSVLFRSTDEGRTKVEVAAERLREINPEVCTYPLHGNVLTDIGLGIFRSVDVVIGCLDNVAARVAINQACYRVGTPWIEGAIENLWGHVMLVQPSSDSACYNCMLDDSQRRDMVRRRSCRLAAMKDVQAGRVPTTPTSASIVAAMQVQEALKLLHDMPSQPGVRNFINGFTNEITSTPQPRDPTCHAHYTYHTIHALSSLSIHGSTVADLLEASNKQLGTQALSVRLGYELVVAGHCDTCDRTVSLLQPLEALRPEDYKCPHCDVTEGVYIDEFVDLVRTVTAESPLLEHTLTEIGLPRRAIVEAVTNNSEIHAIEIAGDPLEWEENHDA